MKPQNSTPENAVRKTSGRRLARIIALAFGLVLPAVLHANTYTKANLTNSLDQAASWGGTAPGSGDTAKWSGAYSASAVTNTLSAALPGSALSWQGIIVGALSGTALTTNTFYAAITNLSVATESGNVVTFTTKANHGLVPLEKVTIAGVTPAGYNGTFTVLGVPSATTFTVTNPASGLSAGTAFGTVAGDFFIGGSGSAVASSSLTIGTGGIDLSGANLSAVINAVTVTLGGNQTWTVPAGLNLRFGASGTGGANALFGSSSANVTVTGGGVVDLNQSGTGLQNFSGAWTVNSGTTVRGTRNDPQNWGTGSLTLNGGTIAVGGPSGAVGNWTWNVPVTLQSSTTSYIDEQNISGSGRYLKLNNSIAGSGNLTFLDTAAGGASTFTSTDLGYILTGANTFSGTITIGGPVENGIAGRLTPVRVGGNLASSTDTSTGTGTSTSGSLGSATSVVDNGVLTFTLTSGYSLPCAITGTGSLRIGSTQNNSGTGGFIGDAYQVITLTGANSYSGSTVINAGTLTLASGATLPNTSISIWTNSINSGAVINTFDVSALTGGFTVSSGQTLNLNGGQINGTLTCGMGSTNIFAPAGSNTVGTLTVTGNLNLSGGTNTFVLDINNAANDQISVGGTMTATGVTKLQFVPPGSGLNAGTYTLFTATSITATSNNFAIAGLVAGPRPQTFTITNTGTAVQLVVVGNPGNLNWVGDGINNLWNTATTSNWWNNITSAKDVFYTNDIVTFDDTGSNLPAINLVSGENPSAVNVNASQNYVFSGAGQIAGAASLTKSGTGMLTLLTSNSFSGGVLVTGGTLAITNDAALGNVAAFNATNLTLDGGTLLTTNSFTLGVNTNRGITLNSGGGTLAVTNASTLVVASKISGGTLTKTGNGTLVLSNLNAHTLTVVNGGGYGKHEKGKLENRIM